jgi:hypothetical protein
MARTARTITPSTHEKREQREERRLARAALVRLREELKEARHRRKSALFEARERCRAERLAVRERTRALRLQVLANLRETTRAERLAAREACALRLRQARGLRDDESRARATLTAERKFQRELHAAERAHHARKKSAEATCGSCKHESDEDVIAALPSDLAVVYDRVKKHIKPTGTMSKAESFLKYAEKHPEIVLEATADPAHEAVKVLEAKHADVARKLNPYEEKKARRIERMRARAERMSRESAASRASAQRIADLIPMGQPILVGHHSERRHRRDLNRIQGGYEKSVALHRKAKSMSRRADYAASNRAISSDDPDAVEKLRARLQKLDGDRARMVEANKAVRGPDPRAALARLGFGEGDIENALTPDFMGRLGFPDFALRNAAGEAARLRKRIEELEKRASTPAPPPIEHVGARIEEAENRVRIFFDQKPDEAIRTKLKRSGFRWSPTVGAWQRHASPGAWYDAKQAVASLAPLTSSATPAAPLATVVRLPTAVKRANAPRSPTPAEAETARLRELAEKHRTQPAPKAPELRDTAQIAARIREDVKAAVKAGELPRAKYSVTTDKYSMGSSITVVASGLPFPVLNPDAFVVIDDANWTVLDSRYKTRFTDRALEVEKKLEAIVDAYHWDRSDPMSDIYNERFARTVKVEQAPGEYAGIEKAKLAEARARRGF